MFLVFVDECGYQSNWASPKSINEQPVYVCAAVAIDSGEIASVYASIRNSISSLNLPHTAANALGKGQEIKARSVDRRDDFWGANQALRDQVRRIYLDLPCDAVYFAVSIDKARHKKQYHSPEDPSNLALNFLLERLQGYMGDCNEHAIVFIDANKRAEEAQRGLLAKLLRWGSSGFGVSRFYGTIYQWQLPMSNIQEIHFGDSKYSIGLQVADFVARHTYSWWKRRKDPTYPGWSYIEPRLWKYPNYQGWGYKEFP